MSFVFSFPLVVPLVSPAGDRIERPYLPNPLLRSPLGFGLAGSFQRDGKGDFSALGGADLVRSCLAELLGIQAASEYTQGELPWRTELGSLLYLLRHHGNDTVVQALARQHVADAIRRWEPRVRLKTVTFTVADSKTTEDVGNVLVMKLVVDIVSSPGGNNVTVSDLAITLEA